MIKTYTLLCFCLVRVVPIPKQEESGSSTGFGVDLIRNVDVKPDDIEITEPDETKWANRNLDFQLLCAKLLGQRSMKNVEIWFYYKLLPDGTKDYLYTRKSPRWTYEIRDYPPQSWSFWSKGSSVDNRWSRTNNDFGFISDEIRQIPYLRIPSDILQLKGEGTYVCEMAIATPQYPQREHYMKKTIIKFQ